MIKVVSSIVCTSVFNIALLVEANAYFLFPVPPYITPHKEPNYVAGTAENTIKELAPLQTRQRLSKVLEARNNITKQINEIERKLKRFEERSLLMILVPFLGYFSITKEEKHSFIYNGLPTHNLAKQKQSLERDLLLVAEEERKLTELLNGNEVQTESSSHENKYPCTGP